MTEHARTSRRILLVAVCLVMAISTAPAKAASGIAVPSQEWSFNGVFGTFDRGELQRGFHVYKEVCAGCHSLNYIAFRNLSDLGFNEKEIKVIASEYEIEDGPNNDGEMYTRAATPSDKWPAPFPNDNAARAGNNGALPPDLSLMVDARAGGADYMYALLNGYHEPPEGKDVAEGMYYNVYYPGNQIAMPAPLAEDSVEYGDGTKATVSQQARDVSAFLAWATEPNMEQRKRMGVKVLLFLLVLTGLFYMSKRRIWADVH